MYKLSAATYAGNAAIAVPAALGEDPNGYVLDVAGKNMWTAGTVTFNSIKIAGVNNTSKTLTVTYDDTGAITKLQFDAALAAGELAVFTDGTNTLTIGGAPTLMTVEEVTAGEALTTALDLKDQYGDAYDASGVTPTLRHLVRFQ